MTNVDTQKLLKTHLKNIKKDHHWQYDCHNDFLIITGFIAMDLHYFINNGYQIISFITGSPEGHESGIDKDDKVILQFDLRKYAEGKL